MNRLALALLLVGLSGLAGGAARAQNTSDVMPPIPQPAPGQGSVYYPGMPTPSTEKPPAPKVETAEPGRGGFVVSDETVEPEEPNAPAEQPSGTYVVKKGDTLWDLSATFFHNPWYWPKLWAANPSITNPHWIYPGDVLRLGPSQATATAAAAAQPEAPARLLPRTPVQTGVFLRQNAFVEPGELEVAGTIVGSKEEKLMLATLDEAYVQYSDKQPLRVGEKYSIYKPVKTVKHPQTGKRLGEIVQILGEVEVQSVTAGHIAKVAIRDATDAIERGYRVGPLKRQFKIVEPTASARELSGVVVATVRPLELLGSGILVFVDKGKDDGVALGNRLQIVRRGDGYQPLLWRSGPIDDKRFPREVIGELIVVDLRDRLATGWMERSAKEARIGDRVELHRAPTE